MAHRQTDPDFLDERIAARAARNPNFPAMVEDAIRRRELLRALADERAARSLSQTKVAASMGSSQSSLARLEGAATDAKLSTVQRLANALGLAIQYHVLSVEEARNQPAVVVHDNTSTSSP
jgi:predicted transcriptional regulator